MQHIEMELTVGQTIRIGNQLITVIDIEESEVSLRVDPVGDPMEGSIPDASEAGPPKK